MPNLDNPLVNAFCKGSLLAAAGIQKTSGFLTFGKTKQLLCYQLNGKIKNIQKEEIKTVSDELGLKL